jgi:hypothetical protein
MYKGYAQELLAIRTPDALYYPLTLPFGPASGPAQFQQRVSEILGDLEGPSHGVASYIDDLGLYATTFEEYLQRLQTMLEKLGSYDIRLNGGKCQFGQKSMDFLGHPSRVSEQGVKHTPERIEAIKNMNAPQTKTQLRSFLGMLNYFRDSVPMLGPAVVPLSPSRLPVAGPKGKGSFKKGEWQEQHQQAFEAAKAAIAGAKLLSYLDYSVPIRLRTDACDHIGAGAPPCSQATKRWTVRTDRSRSCHTRSVRLRGDGVLSNKRRSLLSKRLPIGTLCSSCWVIHLWSRPTTRTSASCTRATIPRLCAGVQGCRKLTRNMLSKCTILQESTILLPMLSVEYTQFRFPLPAQSVRCK